MSFSIRVYGTVDAVPSYEEILEALEENELEATAEVGDDDDPWAEMLVYVSDLDGPISIVCHSDQEPLREETKELIERFSTQDESEEAHRLVNAFESAVVAFTVEIPDEMAEDDTALLMTSLVAQILAQKTDGIYSVDAEGFFDETGELLFAPAEEE